MHWFFAMLYAWREKRELEKAKSFLYEERFDFICLTEHRHVVCDKRMRRILREVLARFGPLVQRKIWLFYFDNLTKYDISPILMTLSNMPDDAFIFVPEELLHLEDDIVRGIFAHELAHLVLGHHEMDLTIAQMLLIESPTDDLAAHVVGTKVMLSALQYGYRVVMEKYKDPEHFIVHSVRARIRLMETMPHLPPSYG